MSEDETEAWIARLDEGWKAAQPAEALAVAQAVLSRLPNGHTLEPFAHSLAGHAHATLADALTDEARERHQALAVAHLRLALPADDPDDYFGLATILTDRGGDGEPEDPAQEQDRDEAVRALDETLRLLRADADSPAPPEPMLLLGHLRWLRGAQRDDEAELNAGISLLQDVVQTLYAADSEDAFLLEAARELGAALAFRAMYGDARTDFDAQIVLADRVILPTAARLHDADPVDGWIDRERLAEALRRRAATGGSRADVERAIRILRSIAEEMPENDPNRDVILRDLVAAYWVRCGEKPAAADLDDLITVARSALEVQAPDTPERAGTAGLLGICLSAKADNRSGRRSAPQNADELVDEARTLLDEAVRDLPAESELRVAVVLAFVTIAYTHAQMNRGSDAVDAEWLGKLAREARDLTEPDTPEHAYLAAVIGALAIDRYHCDWHRSCLDEAITALEYAVRYFGPHTRENAGFGIALDVALLDRAVLDLDSTRAQTALDRVAAGVRGLDKADRIGSGATNLLGQAVSTASTVALSDVDCGPALALFERLFADEPPADPVRRGEWLTHIGSALIPRAVRGLAADRLPEAISLLAEAVGLLADAAPQRTAATIHLSSALVARFQLVGDISDLDAAQAHIAGVRGRLPDDSPLAMLARFLEGNLTIIRGVARGAPAEGGPRPDAFELDLDAHPLFGGLSARVQAARAAGSLRGAPAGVAGRARERVAAGEFFAAANALAPGHPDRVGLIILGVMMLTEPSLAGVDIGLINDAIGIIRTALVNERLGGRARWDAQFALTGLLMLRYGLNQRPLDLQEALDRAEQALQSAQENSLAVRATTQLFMAHLMRMLAAPAGAARARALGLAALADHAAEVFLQSHSGNALERTRPVADRATAVAAWCLEDGEPAEAVRALESGRGLLLQAATAASDTGALLDALGRPDLAEAWRGAVPDQDFDVPTPGMPDLVDEQYVPPALRHAVLEALAESPDGPGRLMSIPGVDQIAWALSSWSGDALAYLVGADEDTPGRVVVVLASGQVHVHEVPFLDAREDTPVAAYVQAYEAYRMRAADPREAGGAPGRTPEELWRGALDAVCEGASAVFDVFDKVIPSPAGSRAGEPRRVVLVPFGVLGMMPWGAARIGPDHNGDPRRALDEYLLTSAASARQFIQAVTRPRPASAAAPVLLADTRGDLDWAAIEAAAIRTSCYPGARYFGCPAGLTPRDAAPGDILALLPGAPNPDPGGPASLLHIACHGDAGASPLESRLKLSGAHSLSVAAIVRQAVALPRDEPGPLVVLGSCLSDATQQHRDEALTVATALLSAGAASVIGALWEAPDRRTAVLMYVFHHNLAARGLRPDEALRAAQRWMADPARTPPAGTPTLITLAVNAASAAGPPLSALDGWAAFVHHGW